MLSTQPTQINQNRFVRLFKDTLVEDSNMRFCFLLGSGASRSSGIQTKNDLTLKWLNEIEEDLGTVQFNRWIEDSGIDRNNLSLYYSDIIKQRFQFEPEMGYKILEQQVSQATPGVGYLVLAQILEKTNHNLAITSNADYLIEDALFSTSSRAPMLFDQLFEQLSEHSSSTEIPLQQTLRPMVYKLQQAIGELNKSEETSGNSLKLANNNILDQAFQTFRPVLIGHSSNNKDIINYLTQHANTSRQPLFWCTQDINKFSKQVMELLTKDDFIVEIEGFDELMFQIINSFDTVGSQGSIHLDYFKRDHLRTTAKQKALEYEKLFNKFKTPEAVAEEETHEANKKAKKEKKREKNKSQVIDDMDQLNDFISSLDEYDHDHHKDDSQFKEALKKDPFNATHNTKYAIFLEDCCSNPEKAADYFKTAMQLDPDNEKIKVLYAFLLNHYFQDYDEAETYYSNAFDIAPESVPINIMFGIFLHTVRKKFMAAEENFQAAFKAAANDSDYSEFMKEIRMDFDATEINYKKSLEESIDETFAEIPQQENLSALS
ncbi:MAG: hypothetical protein V3U78_01625 [Thiotrichaceae bacterium]